MKRIKSTGKYLLLAILSLCAYHLNAQTITTIAGGGSSYSDGAAATAVVLSNTFSVVTDVSGNFYFSEYANNNIRKVNTSGIITNFAGTGSGGFSGDGGAATAATFNGAGDMAIDASGNIYVCDENNHRIRKITPAGVISTFAGNGTPGYSGDGGAATAASLSAPYGIAIDFIGNVYVSDDSYGVIRKINRTGVISTIAGTGTPGFSGDGAAATAARLRNPHGLACDAVGNIYVCDEGNYRVRKISTSGVITTFAGNGSVSYTAAGDGGPATAASFANPKDVMVDTLGNVFISDQTAYRIRVVNTSGYISTYAGTGSAGFSGDGGPATSASLSYPTYMTTDRSNNLLFADYGNNRIRKVNSLTTSGCSGTPSAGTAVATRPSAYDTTSFTVSLSGASAISGQTYQWQVATALGGNTYANISGATNSTYNSTGITSNSYYRCVLTCGTNTDTSRIDTVLYRLPSPIITTIAGTGTAGYSGDGGAGTAAQLNTPQGVVTDRWGNTYIVDYGIRYLWRPVCCSRGLKRM